MEYKWKNKQLFIWSYPTPFHPISACFSTFLLQGKSTPKAFVVTLFQAGDSQSPIAGLSHNTFSIFQSDILIWGS